MSTSLYAQTFQEIAGVENLASIDENYKWLDIDKDDDYDLLSFRDDRTFAKIQRPKYQFF